MLDIPTSILFHLNSFILAYYLYSVTSCNVLYNHMYQNASVCRNWGDNSLWSFVCVLGNCGRNAQFKVYKICLHNNYTVCIFVTSLSSVCSCEHFSGHVYKINEF